MEIVCRQQKKKKHNKDISPGNPWMTNAFVPANKWRSDNYDATIKADYYSFVPLHAIYKRLGISMGVNYCARHLFS